MSVTPPQHRASAGSAGSAGSAARPGQRSTRALRALSCTILLFAPACTTVGLRGSWTGACDFSDGSYGDKIYLDLQIQGSTARQLTGSGRATVPSQGVYDVVVTGEHTLSAVIMDMSIPAQDGDLDLSFVGDRIGHSLDGDCQLWVPGATGAITGTGSLDR